MKKWICMMLAMVTLFGCVQGLTVRAEETTPSETTVTETEPETSVPEETEPEETEPEETEPEETEPEEPQELTSSQEMIDILKTIEGFSARAYWDNGQYTVGYGTRCPDDEVTYYQKNDISLEYAEELLRTQLDSFEKAVRKFADKYSLSFSQNQFDALVSFSYNCGTAWTNDTDGYFNKAIRSGATGSELIYAFCLWSRSGGDFILTKRRMSEANMYLNGVYEACNRTDDGTYPDTYKYVYLDGNGGQVTYIIHGYDAADTPEITYKFSSKPSGYTFAGWYTAAEGGEKVEILDGSLDNGAVLYAHWKNSSGEIVTLPKGTVREPVTVTVTTKVKIRSGPGSFYSAVTTVESGTTLTITETYTTYGSLWGKCEQGWVSLSYTNYQDVQDSGESWPKNGTVIGDNVNVRSGAGTSHTVKYQLNTGDKVTVVAQTYAGSLYWGQLEDGNWICLSYVSFDEEEDAKEPDEPAEPEDDPATPGDANGDAAVNKDDAIYLLRHVIYGDKYPIACDGDINADGSVNKDDAIYLLRHVIYPDKYPLGG